MNYRCLNIGDLHLYNKEIRSTRKLLENNKVMLDNIYNYVEENKDIIFVNFMGDIQHKTPSGKNTLYVTRLWKTLLKKLGLLLRKRMEEYGLIGTNFSKLKVINYDGTHYDNFHVDLFDGMAYPLFIVKGNHDDDSEKITNMSEDTTDYTNFTTFYDDLIFDGIILNPKSVVIETNDTVTQFEYFNYGEADRDWEKLDGVENVVGLYHDTIDANNLDSMFLHGEYYNAVDICDGIDIMLIGHIHKLFEPLVIEVNGNETIFWVVGSMGRTSFIEGQIRDVGYCAEFVIGSKENMQVTEIPLIVKEEYFDYTKLMIKNKAKKDYKDFSVQIENVEIDRYDPRKDIGELTNVPQEVKDLCVKYLTVVMED